MAADRLAFTEGQYMTEEQISATDFHPRRRDQVLDSEMSYVDMGQGDPIIFLHGNATSSYLWRNIIPHVSDLGRCLAPDLIGMGESRRSPTYSYRFSDHARYLDEWFKVADVGGNAIFVVHDWGGRAACVAAALWPERCAGIVSVNSFPIQDVRLAMTSIRPDLEAGLWYFYYFLTERGRAGLTANRREIVRVIWTRNSPNWLCWLLRISVRKKREENDFLHWTRFITYCTLMRPISIFCTYMGPI